MEREWVVGVGLLGRRIGVKVWWVRHLRGAFYVPEDHLTRNEKVYVNTPFFVETWTRPSSFGPSFSSDFCCVRGLGRKQKLEILSQGSPLRPRSLTFVFLKMSMSRAISMDRGTNHPLPSLRRVLTDLHPLPLSTHTLDIISSGMDSSNPFLRDP